MNVRLRPHVHMFVKPEGKFTAFSVDTYKASEQKKKSSIVLVSRYVWPQNV